MKSLIQSSIVLFFLLIGGVSLAQAQNNSINGHVYDAQNRAPVGNLYVELLDTLGISLARARRFDRAFFLRRSAGRNF